MKAIILGILAVTGVAFADQPVRHLDNGIEHFVEEIATPNDVADALEDSFSRGVRRADELVLIEKIINLGQKIWKIIEDNKPVVNVKYMFANAVPKGVKSTEDLDGFTPIQYKSFRVYGKNGFGSTVYDLTYTLLHRYNGTYEGRGRYLDAVTVLPHKLDVLWGYKVNYNVDRVSTVNLGTKDAPIASVLMEMTFKVATVMKESRITQAYEFRGDSADVRSIK